jgi:hypothetical protein
MQQTAAPSGSVLTEVGYFDFHSVPNRSAGVPPAPLEMEVASRKWLGVAAAVHRCDIALFPLPAFSRWGTFFSN